MTTFAAAAQTVQADGLTIRLEADAEDSSICRLVIDGVVLKFQRNGGLLGVTYPISDETPDAAPTSDEGLPVPYQKERKQEAET